MAEPRKCPHCGAKLIKPGGFLKTIGVEIQGMYDGVAYWLCPDCRGAWSRRGTPLTREQVRALKREDIFTL